MKRFARVLLVLFPLAPAAAQCRLDQLVPSGASQGDLAGGEVALDGDRALVAARRDDTCPLDPGCNSGAVSVFERQGATWVETAVLTNGVPGQYLGRFLDLDGSTALLGAASNTLGVGLRDAFVWEEVGGTWLETADLGFVVADPMASDFPSAVALDGDTAMVGASLEAGAGAVFVYDRNAGAWGHVGTLYPTPGQSGDRFGGELALEGDTLLVGAAGVGSSAGAVYVFERVAGVWNQTQFLQPQDSQPWQSFGTVTLSGKNALIAAPRDDSALPQLSSCESGAVYWFEQSASGWVERQKFFPAGAVCSDFFGWQLDLVGSTAVIDEGGSGPAWVYQLTGGAWMPTGSLLGDDPFGGQGFGASVAVSDGRALLGAPGTDEACPTDPFCDSGSAYLFSLATGVAYCSAKTNSLGCTPSIDAAGTPGFSAAGPFLLTARDVLNLRPGLFFYGITGRAALPFSGGILCAMPPLQRTPVQTSGGNPAGVDCSGSYLFDFNAWIASGADSDLAPGLRADGQFWSRDPLHPDGTGVGLTNAIEFDLCP